MIILTIFCLKICYKRCLLISLVKKSSNIFIDFRSLDFHLVPEVNLFCNKIPLSKLVEWVLVLLRAIWSCINYLDDYSFRLFSKCPVTVTKLFLLLELPQCNGLSGATITLSARFDSILHEIPL